MFGLSDSKIPFRIGQGIDTHPLELGGPLIMAGLELHSDYHFGGHGDGDVFSHSVADALAGAAGIPGVLDAIKNNKHFDSLDFLKEIEKTYYFEKWMIVNLDITIQSDLDIPVEYRQKLMEQLRKILVVKPEQINIKTTDFNSEKFTPMINVYSVALIKYGRS